MTSRFSTVVFSIVLAGTAVQAHGQSTDDFRAQIDAAIQKHETAAAAAMGKTRGIMFNDNQDMHQEVYPAPAPPQAAPPQSPQVMAAATSALDIRVAFGYASARLANPSDPKLIRLAQAIADEKYRPYLFLIVGHTDGRGSAAYNMVLSRKRADSVVAFLIATGAPENRLVAIGRGKTQLLDSEHPESDVNRRVEVMVMQQAER